MVAQWQDNWIEAWVRKNLADVLCFIGGIIAQQSKREWNSSSDCCSIRGIDKEVPLSAEVRNAKSRWCWRLAYTSITRRTPWYICQASLTSNGEFFLKKNFRLWDVVFGFINLNKNYTKFYELFLILNVFLNDTNR